jgi:UDP-N-acetylmuramoyl-L-alanyl-D-glutamate--2,6-diaminopimelate ligase
MGAASSRADRVVLTSDNPRGEDPARIADAIRAGIAPGTDVRVVLDRREAIRSVVLDAGEDDVILVAGKGHETDQTVGGVTRPFDDAAEARAALALRGRSGASSPSSST